MLVKVYNKEGQETAATVELPDSVFGIEPNTHAMYLDVKQYLAHQRQGTHKAKERSEMSGSTRKLHKQKGTGGARKGDINNPLYKGGGTIFGPKPHKYDIKLNRKVKDLAKMSALAHKAKANAIVVLEDVVMDAPKTKTFAGMLKSLNIGNKKALFVIPEYNNNMYLSLRNVQGVNGTLLSDMNTYDILDANVLVLLESAAKLFSEAEA